MGRDPLSHECWAAISSRVKYILDLNLLLQVERLEHIFALLDDAVWREHPISQTTRAPHVFLRFRIREKCFQLWNTRLRVDIDNWEVHVIGLGVDFARHLVLRHLLGPIFSCQSEDPKPKAKDNLMVFKG